MRRIMGFLLGAACGAGAVWFSYTYHVVRTESDWLVVARRGNSAGDLFADVRAWNAEDWQDHPRLSYAMVQAGHGNVLQAAAAGQLVDELFGRWKKSTATPATPDRQ